MRPLAWTLHPAAGMRRARLPVLVLVVSAIIAAGILTFQPGRLNVPHIDPPRDLPDAGALWLPNQTGTLKFAVMGDVGRGDARQYETARQMTLWHDRFPFDLVLMLGDNIYGPGTTDDYALRFERPYGVLLERDVSFRAVVGNHDPPGQEWYAPFGMEGHRHYTFTRLTGPPWAPRRVRFFAVDTLSLDRAQLAWLDRELRASEAGWTIAFFHHPLYTSGRYRFRASTLRFRLEPLFIRGGVDVAFSGHEHFYERIRPQHGIQYFTSGAGGALRVGDLEPTHLTASGFDRDTHFILVEIAGDTLFYQVISRAGQTVDFGEVPRDQP